MSEPCRQRKSTTG